jgi:hypothetical protein
MSTILISVTAEDISSGDSRQPCYCPAAKAIRRHLKVGFRAGVWRNTILILDSTGGMVHPVEDVPNAVSSFVAGYDAGQPVSPFQFHLRVPKRYLA